VMGTPDALEALASDMTRHQETPASAGRMIGRGIPVRSPKTRAGRLTPAFVPG